MLAEQFHPHTGDPISVSPLTWSHATYVVVVLEYLIKLRKFERADKQAGMPLDDRVEFASK